MVELNMQKSLTEKNLVSILDKYLYGWAYKDIERASIKGKAKFAGFILGACFIDAMAGFYAGIDKSNYNKGSGVRFKKFVRNYLPKYSRKGLYYDLRCGLVHSYSEGGTYVFTDSNKAGEHLDKTLDGKIILNLEDFLSDLKSAYKKLRSDILSNKEIFNRALRRYNSLGLIQFVSIQVS